MEGERKEREVKWAERVEGHSQLRGSFLVRKYWREKEYLCGIVFGFVCNFATVEGPIKM